MGGLLRLMFVNTTSDTPATITVKTSDKVDYKQLLTYTPPKSPAGNAVRGVTGAYTMTINAGEIWGVVTGQCVEISNPNSAAITIVTANGKERWPQPPPPSKLQSQIDDYPTRYDYFLTDAASPVPSATPAPITICPVDPAATSDHLPVVPPSTGRRVRALLIAGYDVDSDQPGDVTPNADEALRAIEADLRTRFADSQIQIETLTMPTADQVGTAMDALRAHTQGGDLFLVMFAGHGEDAVGAQLSQAWMLSPSELFTDAALALELLKLADGIDAVVISDCCYGEGFFSVGPTIAPTHGLPPPELSDLEKLEKLRRQSQLLGSQLASVWDKLRDDDNSAMVCIAAASASGVSSTGYVETDNLPLLATQTAHAADVQQTYAMLRTTFRNSEAVGRSFYVDARPVARINNIVLGTAAPSQASTSGDLPGPIEPPPRR